MVSLWSQNSNYTKFNPKKHGIADVFGKKLADILPYCREYDLLNNEQLLQLIKDAKRYNWQALDLACCGLSELPDELWELTQLRILFIGNDFLERELEYDDLRKNKISIIPRGIEKLNNLQALSLRGLSCTIDKDTPLCLNNLYYLDLFETGFSEIPNALMIPSIKELGYSCPNDHLQPNFTILRNLRRLFLTNSSIIDLPENIDQLQQLEEISMWRTKIATLPSSLLKLEKLRQLNFRKTPLANSIPPEILHQSPQEMIRYVISQQSNALKEYFNESKMIIVGQGAVGKTSLLKRLVYKEFDKEKSTEGINISKWDYRYGTEDIRLNVWDFGGQEIYHSTHQFFLTKRSLYILVWDVLAEKEYGRIDYWLRTIQSLAEDSPIIIVVNKCDQGIGRIDRLDFKEYLSKYQQIKRIMYVSCKDNICIGQLRKLIQKTACELPLMKTRWLSTWMNVRRRIEREATDKYYISYSEYLSICNENRITDEEEALSLIKYLHDLGIVLYYYDDPLLKHLVILSSEWGTDAVYKIIDEQERRLKNRNGILLRDDLKHIWKDRNKYPEEYFPHLLNLMIKFQLAFSIDQNTYLVAELLNNESIDLGWSFTRLKTLSFRYEYDFLPAGVMTRFIVSANQFLAKDGGIIQCWRKGAYLHYSSAKALVRLYDDISKRYIQIDIIGKSPRAKRDLLSIIRNKIDEINNRFRKITITQKIPCCCSENCSYMFDYQRLLYAEQIGKEEVECQETWKTVPLSMLLDGVEGKKTRNSINYYVYISGNVNVDSLKVLPRTNMNLISFNGPETEYSTGLETQSGGIQVKKNINYDLLQWSQVSSLYKMAVGPAFDDKNLLCDALGSNESKRYRETYKLMHAVWHNHPELGISPDYKLLSDMEYGEQFYAGYRDHTTHMFKVFLLGLYLYENSEKFSDPIKAVLTTDEAFLSVWILTALYHDFGYIIETEDGCWDSIDGETIIKRFNECLKYPISNLFPEDMDVGTEKAVQRRLRRQVFEADQESIQRELEHFHGIGQVVRLSTVTDGNPIKEYYNFVSSKRQGREYYDHGIVSACMLLYACEEVCCYMEDIKKGYTYLQPNQQEKLDYFLNYSDKYKELSEIAAQAIALHNIHKNWNQAEVSNLYALHNVTISSFRIPQKELPIAYLLRVCDELQCWDRQGFVSPLGEERMPLDPDKLSLNVGPQLIELSVIDEKKCKDIAEVLSDVLEPPLDQVLTLKDNV